MSLSQAIAAHLYDQDPTVEGLKYQSSFVALLGDARGAAQRDERGRVRPGCQSSSWLGATGYLVLLDQIGKCFRRTGPAATDDRAFVRALQDFSKVTDQAVLYALYALRCALAHDYSLFNDKSDPRLRHTFNFTADPSSPLVTLPTHTWSRVYDPESPPPEEEITMVNLRKVGDLVEGVVAELKRRHATGELEVRLPLDEFRVRYGMLFRVPAATRPPA